MLFNSSEFIFLFLPCAVVLHFLLARWSVTAAVTGTAFSSLLFYAWWKPPFVLLPMLSIVANFLLAQAIRASGETTARRLMIGGIAANLFVLGWFKYSGFVVAVFRNDDTDAAAQGTFTHVYVERATNKPVPLPDVLKTALAKIAR